MKNCLSFKLLLHYLDICKNSSKEIFTVVNIEEIIYFICFDVDFYLNIYLCITFVIKNLLKICVVDKLHVQYLYTNKL